MKRYIPLLIAVLLATSSCKQHFPADPQEDYEALFPFQGIDKPERDESDVIIRKGDIDVTAATFQYPGDNDALPFTRYRVTLKYTFTEAPGQPGDRVDSRYVLRFVNAKKKLTSIGSNPNNGFLAPEEEETAWEDMEDEESYSEPFMMYSGMTYTHEFEAASGFALYLCVNGHGLRGSRIVASITAVSLDGSIAPITLKVEGIQPHEGTQQLLNPYCEYVILP